MLFKVQRLTAVTTLVYCIELHVHWHLAPDWSWHTEQYCISNSSYCNSLEDLGSSTVMPCMHTSQRVKEYHKNTHGNWQLSLRVEKKPLSLSSQRSSNSGLLMQPRMRWGLIDIHTVYSAQPIYTLSHAIASSDKVKKLKIGKWRPKLANKVFSEKSIQIMRLERYKEPYNTANWTHKLGM